ncbi:hypothetical protein [Porphyromonas gulae]|uniref:hypothetical protein n=1 Tax=Porphyromonas gulae TaxID=111105 RepID=UPI0034E95593
MGLYTRPSKSEEIGSYPLPPRSRYPPAKHMYMRFPDTIQTTIQCPNQIPPERSWIQLILQQFRQGSTSRSTSAYVRGRYSLSFVFLS